MAGSNPAFNEVAFRAGIRQAMQMGAPNKANEQVAFIVPGGAATYWKSGVQLQMAPRLDHDGRPLDPQVEVRKSPDIRLNVDCAYEFQAVQLEEMPVGLRTGSAARPTKLTVTLFDVDREAVKNARTIEAGGDRYAIAYWPPPNGLFGVTIYQVVAFALDEK